MRRVPASADRYDHELWAKLAAQGVTGLLVEPEYGRVGLGAAELEAVAEETGAALPPAPFLSSAVLTVALVRAAGTTADKQRLLPKLADGTAIGTVAVTGPRGNWAPDGVDIRAGADGTLTGTAHYVTSGQIADVILVVAQTHDGPAVFHVAPDAPGFQRTAAAVFDPATLSTYTFTASPSQRIGTAGWEAVQQALDLAVIALVGEQAGGARRIFDLTVDHLKTRIQFGRPIVSFQALKHMAADLSLQVESATSAAQNATARYEDAENRGDAVALAGFACAEAYVHTAMQAIQLHGGIGFTWEHPAHPIPAPGPHRPATVRRLRGTPRAFPAAERRLR